MELANTLFRYRGTEVAGGSAWNEAIRLMLLMLAPAAPHVTEELWSRLVAAPGDGWASIHAQRWPTVDAVGDRRRDPRDPGPDQRQGPRPGRRPGRDRRGRARAGRPRARPRPRAARGPDAGAGDQRRRPARQHRRPRLISFLRPVSREADQREPEPPLRRPLSREAGQATPAPRFLRPVSRQAGQATPEPRFLRPVSRQAGQATPEPPFLRPVSRQADQREPEPPLLRPVSRQAGHRVRRAAVDGRSAAGPSRSVGCGFLDPGPVAGRLRPVAAAGHVAPAPPPVRESS